MDAEEEHIKIPEPLKEEIPEPLEEIPKSFMIEELCVSGGANRGIVYVGAMYQLEKEKILSRTSLKRAIGVSIGSLILGGYLCGYSVNELFKLSMDLDLQTLNDVAFDSSNSNSILKGQMFKEFVISSIGKKENPLTFTLRNLHEKSGVHFSVVVSCIEDGLVHMDHINSPDILLCDALIASMSIPFIFPPHVIDGKRYIDGGFLDNFPMYKLSKDAYGLCNKNKEKGPIDTPFSYVNTLSELIYNHINEYKKPLSKNIIEVDTRDFSFIDFNLTTDDKITLFKRGSQSVKKFLEN